VIHQEENIMSQQQQVPASKQIQQIRDQLTNLMVRKADAEAVVEDTSKQILALRNVLAGVALGQGLEKEISAIPHKPEQQRENHTA
jgi:hypothetical protein